MVVGIYLPQMPTTIRWSKIKTFFIFFLYDIFNNLNNHMTPFLYFFIFNIIYM